MKNEKCERCGNKLTGKQERWCCQRCAKLGLKALYRKRHPEKTAEWRKKYNSKFGAELGYCVLKVGECYFCQKTEKLNDHHICYNPQVVVRICKRCHGKLHALLNKMKYYNKSSL